MQESKKNNRQRQVNKGLAESSIVNRLKGTDDVYIRENTLPNRVHHRINATTHIVCNKGDEKAAEERYLKNYPSRVLDKTTKAST